MQNIVRIEEVIADFVSLKKKGANFWACCPFHHEHTPSFTISPVKGFYKCFGCDAAGDAITFVQQIESISFAEAITYLAQKYGIALELAVDDRQARDVQSHQEKEHLHMLLNVAKSYYEDLLWNHAEAARVALPYLQKRFITTEIAKKFGLGYSMDRWDGFYKFALEKGMCIESLIAAGLVIRSDTKIYDRFRGRLMFPIHNGMGQVVAFAARQISTLAIESPKYINSPETIIYHKGQLLYGISLAKQRIKQENNCFLVEGYTDVLAFHRAGLAHVVASAGTSLTEIQMRYLKRFTDEVTLVFDGDQAGIQAALRGIDKLLAKGFALKVVLLPLGEDPDSYLSKIGTSAFIDYINHSIQDFITFKVGFLFNQTTEQSPAEEAKCIRDIVQSIVSIPDEIEQHLFLKKCSKLLSIEEDVLMSTYHSLRHKVHAPYALQPKNALVKRNNWQNSPYIDSKTLPFTTRLVRSIEAYEREIMRILLTYGATILSDGKRLDMYIIVELGELNFRSAQCQKLLAYCKEVFSQGDVVDIQCCLASRDEEIKQIAIGLMATPHEISCTWIKKYGIYTVCETSCLYPMSLEVILRLKIPFGARVN